jgi:hypothetical protein
MQRTILVQGVPCEIVTLPRSPFPGGPKYEVLAPDGYLFNDELTGLICFDMADVRERASCYSLAPEGV